MSTDETTEPFEPTEEQIEEMRRSRKLERQGEAHFYVELTPEAWEDALEGADPDDIEEMEMAVMNYFTLEFGVAVEGEEVFRSSGFDHNQVVVPENEPVNWVDVDGEGDE